MFGQPDPATQPARMPVPPLRTFEIVCLKPNPGYADEREVFRIECHNLEYPFPGVLVSHVAVEFEQAIVVQVREIITGYIRVTEINPAPVAEASLNFRKSRLSH